MLHLRSAVAIVLVALWVAVPAAARQTRPEAPAAFVVASIKRNVSGLPYGQSSEREDGLALVNERVRDILLLAFDIQDFQLVGAPNWVSSERLDISARAERPLTLDDKRAALRRLLTERLRLRVQEASREQTVYSLRTRASGATGLHSRDCAAPGMANLPCGRGLAAADAGFVRMGGISIARLAAFLSGILGRPVTDETGMTGPFDVDLQWRPDVGLSADLTDEARARINERPALPAALREQLGLDLDAHRGQVRVIVVERIAPPEPD